MKWSGLGLRVERMLSELESSLSTTRRGRFFLRVVRWSSWWA